MTHQHLHDFIIPLWGNWLAKPGAFDTKRSGKKCIEISLKILLTNCFTHFLEIRDIHKLMESQHQKEMIKVSYGKH